MNNPLLQFDLDPFCHLEDYGPRFEKYFAIQRDDQGVIEVRMQDADGGVAPWGPVQKHGWGPLLKCIGSDDDNEVLIMGGSGSMWSDGFDMDYVGHFNECAKNEPQVMKEFMEYTYETCMRALSSLIFDLEIPTIGVINGPSEGHCELALMCDIVLMADTANLVTTHYPRASAPGDGYYTITKKVLGPARANYYAITGESIDAQTALEFGLVSQVVPASRVYDRAHELASLMMRNSRAVRRATHEMMRKDWEDLLYEIRHDAQLQTSSGLISWGA